MFCVGAARKDGPYALANGATYYARPHDRDDATLGIVVAQPESSPAPYTKRLSKLGDGMDEKLPAMLPYQLACLFAGGGAIPKTYDDFICDHLQLPGVYDMYVTILGGIARGELEHARATTPEGGMMDEKKFLADQVAEIERRIGKPTAMTMNTVDGFMASKHTCYYFPRALNEEDRKEVIQAIADLHRIKLPK